MDACAQLLMKGFSREQADILLERLTVKYLQNFLNLDDKKLAVFRNLNAEQLCAAVFFKGSCLVTAGPGTGKTQTMTARAHFLASVCEVQPDSLWLMTFTKKAAAEMKKRLVALEPAYNDMHIGTFHHTALQICKRHMDIKILRPDEEKRVLEVIAAGHLPKKKELLDYENRILHKYYLKGFKSGHYPMDELEEFTVDLRLHQTPVEDGEEEDDREPQKILVGIAQKICDPEYVEYLQQQAARKEDYKPDGVWNRDNFWAFLAILDVYDRLDAYKKEKNLFSFDDLIDRAIRFLSGENHFAKSPYVCVDEFQDSDEKQFLMMELMARNGNNIFCVGDDKQSIYGWRGAKDNVFEEFRARHNPEEINLVKNYRSTPAIIKAVNSCALMRDKRENALIEATHPEGNLVRVFRDKKTPKKDDYLGFKNGDTVSSCAADIIRDYLHKTNCKYSDIAVLFRGIGSSAFDLQARLTEHDIPYIVVGGKNIIEHPVFRMFKYILELVRTPNFALPLMTIDQYFPGIGNTAAFTIKEIQEQSGCKTIGQLISEIAKIKFRKNQQKSVQIFLEVLERLGEFAVASRPSEIFQAMRGLCAMPDNGCRWQDRVKNIDNGRDFLAVLNKFFDECLSRKLFKGKTVYALNAVKGFCNKFSSIEAWINAAQMNDDGKADSLEEENKVYIGTVHSAKGKEWPCVIVGNANQIPSGLVLEYLANKLELSGGNFAKDRNSFFEKSREYIEERNIFYVALSRAEKDLFVLGSGEFCDQMIHHGMRRGYKNEYSPGSYELAYHVNYEKFMNTEKFTPEMVAEAKRIKQASLG